MIALRMENGRVCTVKPTGEDSAWDSERGKMASSVTVINKFEQMEPDALSEASKTFVINVRGYKTEIQHSDALTVPDSRFASYKTDLKKYYNEERKEYVVNCDKRIFKEIENFLLTGKMHIRGNMCISEMHPCPTGTPKYYLS